MGNGSSAACSHIVRFNPPDMILNGDLPPPNTRANVSSGVRVVDRDVAITMTSIVRERTYWSSSARPLSHRSDFALAASSGTLLITENESGYSLGHLTNFGGVDVLAVDWLNENVVLNGSRDGFLRLWDVRIPTLEGTSAPLKHPSTINHVRRLNENRIVVAGIKNKLSVYDMRFLRKSKPNCTETEPFVDFPTYKNCDRSGLHVGLDVLRDQLIAVGTDDEKVQVFDAGSGREVDVGTGGVLGRSSLGGLARCLRFVDGEGTREGTRLYVAAGDAIQEWAW